MDVDQEEKINSVVCIQSEQCGFHSEQGEKSEKT